MNEKTNKCTFGKFRPALTQLFSCQFCKNFKSTFFSEHLWWLLLSNITKLKEKKNRRHNLKMNWKQSKTLTQISAPHPDVFWHCLNGMDAQKKKRPKSSCNLYLYIFHVKTKWNIVYKYLKTKIFSRDTNILWTLSYSHWGFWVSLNYPILNFKKMVCPKNIWMRYWIYSNYS